MKTNQGKSKTLDTGTSMTRAGGSGSLSSKAFEYYRMYSGTEELPKYFSGDCDDLVNLRGVGATAALSTPTITPTTSSLTTVRHLSTEHEINSACASPTSSIISTKKQLEWDSGADIGYALQLQKSSSMPTLDLPTLDPHKIVINKDKDQQHANSVGESSHKEVMTFLMHKVGLPVAESTPIQLEVKKSGSDPVIYSTTLKSNRGTKKLTTFSYEVTPSTSRDDHYLPSHTPTPSNVAIVGANAIPLLNSDSTSSDTNSSELFAKYRKKKLKHLQIAPAVSVEFFNAVDKEDCQTQTTLDNLDKLSNKDRDDGGTSIGIQTTQKPRKGDVLVLFHPSKSLVTTSSTSSSARSSNINDNLYSNCNSFEYVTGNCQDDTDLSDKTENIKVDCVSSTMTMGSSLSSDPDKLTSKSSSTSTKEPSGDEDLERSLRMIKRLMKSKKYDTQFKQAYVKKMARKLLKTKDMELLQEPKSVGEIELSEGEVRLSNVAVDKVAELDVPDKLVEADNLDEVKSDKLIDTNDDCSASWKKCVTNSEKFYSSLETNSDRKDCVVSFAKREREHQLDWINNEINHLAKIKSLLETKKKTMRTVISASVPNIVSDYKSTAVYVITTEKNGGDACVANCQTKTTKCPTGEIEFHVHDNLGVRDYQFKELVTKIIPHKQTQSEPLQSTSDNQNKDEVMCSELLNEHHRTQAPSVGHSKNACNHCFSEQRMSPQIICKPCRPCKCARLPDTQAQTFFDACAQPSLCQAAGANGAECAAIVIPPCSTHQRRHRDIFPVPVVEGAKPRSRSRSPSPKSTSITDDTSGYPSRPRRHSATPSKKTRDKRRRDASSPPFEVEYSIEGAGVVAGAAPRKHTVTQKKAADSDTDSSQYESLTKYQTSTTKSSRLVMDPVKNKKEAPCHYALAAPPVVGHGQPCGGGCLCQQFKDKFPAVASPINIPPTLHHPKKDSYRQYKAQKLKEKELQEEMKKLLAQQQQQEEKIARKTSRDKYKAKERAEKERRAQGAVVGTVGKHRIRERDKEDISDAQVNYTSDPEPKSISDDEVSKYKPQPQIQRKSPTAIQRWETRREALNQHKPSLTRRKSSRADRLDPTPCPVINETKVKTKAAASIPPTPWFSTQTQPSTSGVGTKKRSKTDTEVATRHSGTGTKPRTEKGRSKTDSEVKNTERFTNTEGTWNEDDDDNDVEFEPCPQPPTHFTSATATTSTVTCKCQKSARNMCACGEVAVPPPPPAKTTGTVSLQTLPICIEKGVSVEKQAGEAKDVQVQEPKPLVKQAAVGEDVTHNAKETASQMPQEKGPHKAALSLTPAAVMTYIPTPSAGDQVITSNNNFGLPRPYKMVKDLSKINLRSAVVISSVVTSSVSNPEDNIRRLVLEMPLNEKEEDDMSKVTESKRHDKKSSRPEMKESDLLSLLSCSCLQSSSRISTTSATEVMCSCCGKCVVSSESSLILGDNNVAPGSGPFCWPCYCASTKREWNPQEPFYQQPDHMCKCHNNKIEDNALEKIRDTLRQLAEIDNQEESPRSSATKVPGKLVCHSCNKKIKRDTTVKKPVAYVLKFEPGEEVDDEDDKHNNQSLQEIRVKVPVKNKKVSSSACSNANCKKKRKATIEKADTDCSAGTNRRDANSRNLQECLLHNRPEFIRAAEQRRRCLIELAYMRKQRANMYQELLDLSDQLEKQQRSDSLGSLGQDFQKKRLFTTKEMKRITAKNYKKLPEVQQQILNNKKQSFKNTNKLLVNIFNQKLKETVLRGKPSLSTSVNVIQL